MHLSIVYLAVLATSWVKGGEAYKCDPNIIASMKKFNKEAPSHIMATVRKHLFLSKPSLYQ